MNDLNIQQQNAVRNALTKKLSIVTGPPGSGKTKLIQGIVQAWRFENETTTDGCIIYILSPTGKASKVIHRLKFPMIVLDNEEKLASKYPSVLDKPVGKISVFSATIDFFLSRYTAHQSTTRRTIKVIVDECSMCDSIKLYQCMMLLNPTSIVLIGDVNQLPCVTQSSVEKPLFESLIQSIDSKLITTLTQVYRYDVNSALGVNVAARNIVIKDDNCTFKLVELTSQDELKTYILRANLSNPQFICVYNKQRESLLKWFPNEKKCRIICRKNYYDKESGKLMIANGDIGKMSSKNRVKFDGKKYDSDFVEFERADVITVHLSQGDEYDNVVLISPMKISDRLFYTAISRAKKKCLVLCVGTIEIVPENLDERINPISMKGCV